ncbi:MAG: alpha/beta hydrolase [Candidatus Comchoanobacterales bacterium]
MKFLFKSIAMIVFLSGCQSMVQKPDQPFDPLKYDPNLISPAFQEHGYDNETYQQYTDRVDVFLTKRLEPYYELKGESPYEHNLSLEDRVAMSKPQEFLPRCSEGQKPKAILMFHGLNNGVYDLTSIAERIHDQIPCSWIRIPVLKGSDSLSGDTLTVDAQTDWLEPSIRLYYDFLHQPGVESVSVVGYSFGGLMGLLVAQHAVNNNEREPSQLILVVPAIALLESDERLLPLANLAKLFKPYFSLTLPNSHKRPFWSPVGLSYNQLAQFWYLYNQLDRHYDKDSDLNIQAWFTAGDDRIDTSKSVNTLCKVSENTDVYVYQKKGQSLDLTQCDKSHTTLLDVNSPDVTDISHYGIKYPKNKRYFGFEDHYCQDGMFIVFDDYDDITCDEAKAMDWRFGLDYDSEQKLLESYFNPYFDTMVDEMIAFIKD